MDDDGSPGGRTVLVVAGGVAVGGQIASDVAMAVFVALPSDHGTDQLVIDAFGAPAATAVVVVAALVGAPLLEEVVFRGVVLAGPRTRFGFRSSASGSAVVLTGARR